MDTVNSWCTIIDQQQEARKSDKHHQKKKKKGLLVVVQFRRSLFSKFDLFLLSLGQKRSLHVSLIMITRFLQPLVVFCFIVVATIVSAKFSNQAQIAVCSNGTRLEPSLKEIFESLIPHDLPDNELAKVRALYESYFNVNKHTGKNIISQRIMEYAFQLMESISSLTVPLRSMISDGTYTVDMTTDWFYFRDVLLVQQNFFVINTLCSMIPYKLTTVRAILCKCFIGEELSPRDAMIASSRFNGFHAGNAHEWCVRNPCTDRSTRDGRFPCTTPTTLSHYPYTAESHYCFYVLSLFFVCTVRIMSSVSKPFSTILCVDCTISGTIDGHYNFNHHCCYF